MYGVPIVLAQTNLTQNVTDFFNDVQNLMSVIAPIAALIGFAGLGIMYLGASFPLIGDWKRDNPKAANQVVWGLLFLTFASSVVTMVTLPGA